MNTEIIVAILAFVGTLAGSYFSNNKTTAVIQEQIKNIKEDISILSNISMLLYRICNKNKFRFYT